MEPQETTVEAAAESLATPVEVAVKPNFISSDETKLALKPVVSAPEPTKLPSDTDIASPQIATIWNQIMATWEEYFGDGKKSNVTIALLVSAIIPLLIATSAILDFLNKLPILPSVFELVGFGYSIWFAYRYLLLANTRKELTDAIAAWKNQVLG